jgi:hypothetical protein
MNQTWFCLLVICAAPPMLDSWLRLCGFLVGLNHNLVNNLVQCGLKYQYGWGWAGFCTRGIGLGGVINRRKHVWTGVGLVQISAHCQVELERREYTVTRTK